MRVTASKAGLLEHCQYFARLEAEWATTSSEAAERGTRFHRAIAYYIEFGDLDHSDVADMVAVAAKWVDAFGREKLAAEVAFAWNPTTDEAERIPAVERDYQAGHGRLCGTADIVAVSRVTKTGYVGDWATGDGTRKGPQLRTLAVMLARAEGLDSVTVEGLEVTAEGVRSVCRETLDAFALAAHAGELADGLAAVATAEPQPGPHCGELYCPARATCPAVRERLADIIPAEALTQHRWGLTIASPDHAMWLYNQAKAVEAAAKLVKDAVKAFVPEEGLTLSDGSVLAESERQMPRFDKAKALGLARELGATDEQIEACTYVATESAGLRVKKPAKARKRAA